MKVKMIERMKNFAGSPKPKLAVRVQVNALGSDGNFKPADQGIFPVHPNKTVKCERAAQ